MLAVYAVVFLAFLWLLLWGMGQSVVGRSLIVALIVINLIPWTVGVRAHYLLVLWC